MYGMRDNSDITASNLMSKVYSLGAVGSNRRYVCTFSYTALRNAVLVSANTAAGLPMRELLASASLLTGSASGFSFLHPTVG